MAPVSIDDLIASLKGNGIGQEANDLAAVKAHLSQTLGTSSTQNGYTPTHTSNTPQGTPVSAHPPMGAPWDTRTSRRHRSQSRGFDMAIDEEGEEPVAESSMSGGMMGSPVSGGGMTSTPGQDRWRSPQRKAMHSPQESFSGQHPTHNFPQMSPISPTLAPPLSPPASPTRMTYPHHPISIPASTSPYAHHSHPHAHQHPHAAHPHNQHYQQAHQPAPHGHPDQAYAASSDPFLQQQHPSQPGAPYYGQFFPQSPPMDCPPPPGWNAGQWQAAGGWPMPVQTGEERR